MIHEDLTEAVIGSFYRVYNGLGFGFLEKVYENALAFELVEGGFNVVQQQPIKVVYRGQEVGEYFADMVVNDLIVLELKAAESLREEHATQLTNYLKATNKEVGLLLNFGRKPEFRRIVFSNTKRIRENPLNPRHPLSIQDRTK